MAPGAEDITRLFPEAGMDGRVGECCGVVKDEADAWPGGLTTVVYTTGRTL